MKKKLFLTGASGFIGRNFHKKFVDKYDITPYDIQEGEDILDLSSVDPFEYDIVIHLAARAGVRKSHEIPNEYWKANVEGSKKIFHEFDLSWKNVPMIYASSSSIYEWWLSPYATTKKIVEELAPKYSLGLRFHTVYGEDSRPDMLYDMLKNKNASYLTRHTRDWTHVNDVCDAIDICIERFDEINLHNKAIDVGNGEPVSVMDMANKVWPNNRLPIKEVVGERETTCAEPDILLEYGWKPKHHILEDL
jgi:UDP-glucuronate 4-epimerase